ncbi:MAG: hypothetical protein GY787_15620, partial [Alteromonadales bacterium]|nr:hypothetical protein [Alteromonadales bacterium]
MFNLFKTKPLLTDEDAMWIFDNFYWALTHFDHEEFFSRSVLVEPSDKFFPGKVDSHQAVATTVFQSTLRYSGLAHWPMQLVHPAAFNSQPPAFLNLDFSAGIKRNSSTQSLLPLPSELPLAITYNLNQTLKP